MSYSKTFYDSLGIKNANGLNVREFFNNINGNKLFLGLMMIFMNLGSRYIEIKLTKGQEMMLKNIAREVLIFTIAFMYTCLGISCISITSYIFSF